MSDFSIREMLGMKKSLQEKYKDILLCYGISPEELRQSYADKFEGNMNRW